MKNIPLIKYILFTFVVVTVISIGCETKNSTDDVPVLSEYTIVVIDSCEYFQYVTSYGYLEITHKGNCKYCIDRNKK